MVRFVDKGLLLRCVAVAPSVSLALLLGCTGGARFRPPAPVPDDRMHVSQPKERSINVEADAVDQQVFQQVEQLLDFSRDARWLVGKRKEAMNVDAFDGVANSSWYTNRNAKTRMTIEDIRRGPDGGSGPDTASSWEIFRAKTEGVTPGFSIIDKSGERYVIKFDPKRYPELITGAEVVSTKLFYAAGYHVPQNNVVYFHPRILRLGDKVKFVDDKGKKRPMTRADLDEILSRVTVLPGGRIRALASKYVDGKPIGPFKYTGTRKDDPNDIIPHHHRRELRGLRVLAAWLAHFDTKAGNSLDSYVTVDGRSYVRHYLIDFGSTLGAGAEGPIPKHRGSENEFDPHAIAFNTLTAGLYVRPYEKLTYSPYPSVGLYQSKNFEPQDYKFLIPNSAFENMTDRDGFWAAVIVTSFTDEQIDAVVGEARYSDPAAAEYIARVIKERRDKVGEHWFGKMSALGQFDLRHSGEGWKLSFVDLAVLCGLEDAADAEYRFTLRHGGETIVRNQSLGGRTTVEWSAGDLGVGAANADGDCWACRLEVKRQNRGGWCKPVTVFFGYASGSDELTLLGLERDS